MEREELRIIIPTHDSYIDVFAVFIQLFEKNWKDCPYRLVLSCNGYAGTEYKNIDVVNNPGDAMITARVRNAAEKFPAENYLILLEDMFIDKPVNNGRFAEVLEFFKKAGLHYCKLNFKCAKENEYTFPSKATPYGISFGAFICDNEYIDRNFDKNITGWDFENEQLKETLGHKKKEKFTDCAQCNGNPLNIVHGIHKGKWIRSAKKQIEKDNPEVDLGKRERLSRKETFKNRIYSAANRIGPKTRVRIKRILKHLGFKFTTDF